VLLLHPPQPLLSCCRFESGIKLWLPNISQPKPNLAVFQVNFAAPAEFDLVFVTQPNSDSAETRLEALHGKTEINGADWCCQLFATCILCSSHFRGSGVAVVRSYQRLHAYLLRLCSGVMFCAGDALTKLAAEREAAFDQRFADTFPISNTPNGVAPHDLLEVSKAALSNTLGSIGYFVGASRVKLPPSVKPPTPPGRQPSGMDPSIVEYWREALFTATPSRSFFPRGFLWDEGFHQLLVQRWDAQLSRDVISHWLDLMNKQGWIPREQILGKEARARVPVEFLVQHPSHANPPSLYLPLLAHAAAASGGATTDPEAQKARAFLKTAWPRLEAWYKWFNTTQTGTLPGSYM
jgi:hypothetical protein